MKKLISFTIVFLCLLTLSFAQDSTFANPIASYSWYEKASTWAIVAVSVYELLVRLIPTVSNWSILSVVINVIKYIFPNRKANVNPNSYNHKDKKTHD